MRTVPQPTAYDAVTVALFTAWKDGLDGVKVLDGPTVTPSKGQGLVIGATASGEAATVEQRQLGRGGAVDEVGEIMCAAWSWSGSVGFTPRRQALVAMIGACRRILLDDRTLGGACDDAYLGDQFAWLQKQTASGALVSVGFSVHYLAGI